MSAGLYTRTRAVVPFVALLLLALLLWAAPARAGTPPVITQQPQSQSAPLLGIVTFSVTAYSDTTMSYQWYKNGVAIPGANSSSYTILTVLGSDAGAFSVKVCNAAGCVMSDTAYLNIPPPPTITSQPQSQAVIKSRSASFSVSASSSLSMTYQWYFNGSPLSGATTSTYSIAHAMSANAGNYRVVVANSTGGTTSQVATLTVLIPASISTEPANVTAIVGQNATFTVGATGTAPLTYQWRFNGTNMPGATNSSLTLLNVQPANAGRYKVEVDNAAGSDESSDAVLTVIVPPSITSQPQDTNVMAGQNAAFSVSASGSAPMTCQWYFNGTALPGATNSVLSLVHVDTSNAGGYSVVVSNAAGSVTSSVASLTVTPLPPIVLTTVQPANVPVGFSFQVTVPQGYTYIVLASSDLQNWTPIATNVALTGSDIFTDTDSVNYSQRFYRTVLP